jgi:hypothetical protein
MSEMMSALTKYPFRVRVSDFGLATELKESKKLEGGLYNLTGMTGSPIYMAPGKGLLFLSSFFSFTCF